MSKDILQSEATSRHPGAPPFQGNPYLGVLPFRYADRDYFFGREKVVGELYAKVLLYRLVLLFGESGAGKSSVINAGLIPALEKEGFQAERLRVSPEYEDQPILVERIEGGVEENISYLPSIFIDEQSKATSIAERIPCSIERFLSSIRDPAKETTPLLIFDQFEELFTLFTSKKNGDNTRRLRTQNQILQTIYEIANDQDLETRILIIIREDFLGKLEILSKSYPQIFDHRIRLGHLTKDNALKAITGPFENNSSFGSKIDEDLAQIIVRELADDNPQGLIHATQLQIVCDQLWRMYASQRAKITESEFAAEGRVKGLLEGYLTSELEKLGASRKHLAIRILGSLITDSDTRDIVSEDKLKGLLNAQNKSAIASLHHILKLLEVLRIINCTTQRDLYYYEVASEYLIKPIKRAYGDLQLTRQRNRWLGAFAALVLLSPFAYWGFSAWLESQPWGYLLNLSTGNSHTLQGDFASIGRATTDNFNQIALEPREISRMHLFISKKLTAIDVRSLNGTTVNAEFLPYGSFEKLKDGDIITLAGIAPFQFANTPVDSKPPPSSVGILIDGRSRTVHYLIANRHFLSVNKSQHLVVSDDPATHSLLSITHTDGQYRIRDAEDEHDLWVTMRVGDYTYVSCKIPPDREFVFFNFRELGMDRLCKVLSGRSDLNDITRLEHDLFTVTYSYGNSPFQIVPIVPDLEPATSTSYPNRSSRSPERGGREAGKVTG